MHSPLPPPGYAWSLRFLRLCGLPSPPLCSRLRVAEKTNALAPPAARLCMSLRFLRLCGLPSPLCVLGCVWLKKRMHSPLPPPGYACHFVFSDSVASPSPLCVLGCVWLKKRMHSPLPPPAMHDTPWRPGLRRAVPVAAPGSADPCAPSDERSWSATPQKSRAQHRSKASSQ